MKELDLQHSEIQEMNAEEMIKTVAGWKLFGSETTQGFAVLDENGWGYEYTTTTYIFGIAVSSKSGVCYVS